MENKPKRPGGPGGHGGPMGHGMVLGGAKAKDFKGSMKRLLNYLKPMFPRLILIFVLAGLSTLFAVASPKILGSATNTIVEGVARITSGTGGIDFTALSKILMLLAGFYILSAFFNYLQQYLMACVAQSTVFTLRKDVNAKLARLPLKYFDSHPHGDVLSTITNDVDNISNTLQQSITQLITSAVTLIGVTVMMFSISTLLTIVI